ncbi:MAG: 2-C-methyl-D-erythritol 2,4-cyclodiphosphate synthase [Planctomycetes bacterium]|nr:2-C-methyl-D-erythritol 2,4-cyclodiphosphate synthase [Planctomycetota bacterium]
MPLGPILAFPIDAHRPIQCTTVPDVDATFLSDQEHLVPESCFLQEPIRKVLGAIKAGDIGRRYPDTDMRYAGVSSRVFLKGCAELLRQRGWEVRLTNVSPFVREVLSVTRLDTLFAVAESAV